ncbi:hypothetical protein AMATHDRAFT_70223 [Amanita thiersii Skay4041]|uniref:Amino acid transporter transmembrane domain-containing protein n=1 Tax=Amanita thiersii Skay4041 TaxID=703135 RepID=A0A2A9NF47_9AGAR|nr:hypothetical protein AMATHDRAFT_70223 [Amanita thiersii Skay4041]
MTGAQGIEVVEDPREEVYATSSGQVLFEEYLFYAALQRQEEEKEAIEEGRTRNRILQPLGKKNLGNDAQVDEKRQSVVEKEEAPSSPTSEGEHQIPPMTPEQIEHANAARALRLASWASIFYLITTDILGPFNAPFAISQVGWAPGVILYFFMGAIALYTGLILWRLFCRLDSLRYPLKTYSDIAERIFGRVARHICTVLQTIQLVINVGTICLSNGQALSQMSRGRLCFSVCIVIWAILGMIIGQIRTLKGYGWLANSAVWINLSIIFISMGFVAHSPPNFESAKKSLGVDPGPVVTKAIGDLPLFLRVNGIMNMVFAYGGSMIFPEMMAEMRRPLDFWKGLALAQMLIFSAYLLYGAFIYAFQGQFTLPLAYQGVSKFSWQTVGNALSLVTGIIAAGLYGNIGIKVIYINIVEGWFNGPRIMSRKGHFLWSGMVLLYWAIAFIIGSAIPQVQTITGLIAAIAIMQFTYSLPLLLIFGYQVITDAMSEDQAYYPGRGTSGRVDTWRQWSRWRRGLFGGKWYYKVINLGMSLGGLAMACLGMWGAGKSIKNTFEMAGAATSFGCGAPV